MTCLERTVDYSKNKSPRYNFSEADLLGENGHQFVDVRKLGLSHSGKCCIDCGIMRRADGQNKPCKGLVKVQTR